MKVKPLLITAISLLMISSISTLVTGVRGDFAVSNSNRSDFIWSGQNLGTSVSISNVTTTGAAYQGGMVVYGANTPNMYSGVMASIECNKPSFLRNMKVTVSNTDPMGNTLSPGRIGNIGMLSSPSSQSNDWVNQLRGMYNLLVSILGSAFPLPSLQNGTPSTGTGSDASSVWAEWRAVNYSTEYCSHGLTLRFQPDFINPGVYTVAVQTHAEVWTVMNTDVNFLASADSSYSFQYVFENDANSGNDAGSTFSTALGLNSLGTYTGLLYGVDTVDMYKFDVYTSQKYYFSMSPPSSADFGISIYDVNWNPVVSSDLGIGRTNSASFTATSTGSYFLKIFLTSGSGTYSFWGSINPPDFSISANPTSITVSGYPSQCATFQITYQSLGYGGNLWIGTGTGLYYQWQRLDGSTFSNPVTLSLSGSFQAKLIVWGDPVTAQGRTFQVSVFGNTGQSLGDPSGISHTILVSLTFSSNYVGCGGGGGGGGGGHPN